LQGAPVVFHLHVMLFRLLPHHSALGWLSTSLGFFSAVVEAQPFCEGCCWYACMAYCCSYKTKAHHCVGRVNKQAGCSSPNVAITTPPSCISHVPLNAPCWLRSLNPGPHLLGMMYAVSSGKCANTH